MSQCVCPFFSSFLAAVVPEWLVVSHTERSRRTAADTFLCVLALLEMSCSCGVLGVHDVHDERAVSGSVRGSEGRERCCD